MHTLHLRIMRGKDVAPKDIVLDLQPIPANLLSDEVLQPSDEEEEQVQLSLYEVGTNCADCSRRILFTVSATDESIRLLEEQLVESSLQFWCVSCVKAKKSRKNGRS